MKNFEEKVVEEFGYVIQDNDLEMDSDLITNEDCQDCD